MSLKEKRKKELDNLKERRMDEVVAAAIDEMQKKGIDNAKISDIAVRAEVGVASVYRYFKTKQELVIAAAIRIWSEETEELYETLEKKAEKTADCIERISIFFEVFVELYKNHKGFVRFIEEFDNYIVKEKIESSRLSEYENRIEHVKGLVYKTLEQGRAQGIIREDIDANTYYLSVTHSLMSLTQKLVLRGTVLESDISADGESQIKLMIAMVVSYLKK